MPLLTEDEAKRKWCPYVTVSITSDCDGRRSCASSQMAVAEWSGSGKPPAPQAFGGCLGSGCMAWREVKRMWLKAENRFAEIGEPVTLPGAPQGADEIERAQNEVVEMRGGHGYCVRLGHPDAAPAGQHILRAPDE